MIALLSNPWVRGSVGDPQFVTFSAGGGAFELVHDGAASPLCVDENDWPGVRRVAGDLKSDIERVSGASPSLGHRLPDSSPDVVVIGTIGHSPLVDRLVAEGKLDDGAVRGKWESWTVQTIEHPAPGIGRALVIAGSDKRGTIFGVYELSQQMGVSPWYWWADVPAKRHAAVYVDARRLDQGPPIVKYRGIFLNDEAPDLTNWVRAKFGNAATSANPPVPPGVANYGHEFYARLFEVILRLRGNYLWPAMWSNAFNEDDPLNSRLADGYGIVMGTSHQEPMLRAQKEWDRRYAKTVGPWNYAKNPGVLEDFWREGIRRNKAYESLVTIGLRGADDTPMAPGGPEQNMNLLGKIVDAQRSILRQEVNPDLNQVPQVWCLYKEVQDFYDAGMKVPDDVTLLWAEDNWGNLRRLPTAAERGRRGGAGIYYHFDYHGSPRSYQWLNTSPLPKVWEQMSLAARYGADRVWIVNVGHFKGYELPTEFFLNMAWNPARWTAGTLEGFTRAWAAREFGAGRSVAIAEILDRYAKFNGRRKPELLAPGTYSLVNYREAETVVADFNSVSEKAGDIGRSLQPEYRDAFTELVEFPATASALVNELQVEAGRNALYSRQGRASANEHAARTRALFQRFLGLVGYYNGAFAGGKWAHFMDQPVLGYTTWRDPPANTIEPLKLVSVAPGGAPSLGVSVEGSADAWPGAPGSAALSRFDALNRQSRYFEVFNRGTSDFGFTATANEPWIRLERSAGTVGADTRIAVSLDWSRVPPGAASGSIVVAGAGGSVRIAASALSPPGIARDSVRGFVEDDGVVSIEAEHFSRNVESGARRWSRIPDYGKTLSGMRSEGPLDAPSAAPGRDSPCLEYSIFLFKGGTADLTVITGPTLNFVPDRGVRLAVSFDDQAPKVVTLVPKGFKAQNGNRAWEKAVVDNAHLGHSNHELAQPGAHTLKVWMVDPDVVLQKVVIDLGGLRESALGPPESMRGGLTESP